MIAIVTAIAVALGAGIIAWNLAGGTAASCSGEIRLSIAVPAEIVSPIQERADQWADDAAGPGDQCVAVDVAAAAPVEVAAALAAAKGVTVSGVGTAGDSTRVPDVWVPDSSTWLQRLATASPDLVPAEAPSVASSPVVIAMPEPVAKTLGWPDAKLTWTSLLQQMLAGAGLKVGIVEPTSDATGLAGLMALGGAAQAAGARAEETTVGALRALVTGRSAVPDDLLARFPRANDAAAIASGLSAAPLSEQAMIAYNASQPAVKLAALYLDPAPPALDYPFAVLPGTSSDKSAVAADLREALSGDEFRSLLAARGLRAADGSYAAAGFPSMPGAPEKAAASPSDPKAVGVALATWISVTMPSRMLAIIDVSGSMLTPVPTAGGATRGQISVEAARQGLALFDNSWSVGLWMFSTELDGDRDYKELLPIGPMATQRTRLASALAQVKPIPGGQTGLYDTVLAAYQRVQQEWDPASVNSIVILTDGQNQDPEGLTLGELTAELKKAVDPDRPIQVIAIGIGNEVSEAELKQITSTAGGGTFIARDPSAIGQIFLQAIALRPKPA